MLSIMRKLPMMVIAALAIVMVGCNENDPVDPGTDVPNPPTGVMATSKSITQVGLAWTAPASGVAPTSYLVMYNVTGSTTVKSKTVTGPATTVTIDSLQEGTVYEFMVHSLNGTEKSTASSMVKWSPASRYSSASLKMYETASANGSGFRFPGTGGLTIANNGSWDLALDTRIVDGVESVVIGAPGALSYTDLNGLYTGGGAAGERAKITLVGKQWSNVTSLDEIYESQDLNQGTLDETGYDITNRTTALGFVVKTADNHYAKVLVKSVGGKVLQGSTGNRFVEVDVSYQSVPGVPYALRYVPAPGTATGTPVKAGMSK